MTVLLQDRMIVQKKKKITVTTRLFINHVLQRKEKYHFKLLQDLKKSYHFSLYFAELVYKNI